MTQLSRRDFLGQTAVAAGTLVAVGQQAKAGQYHVKSARDQVTLGKTGIKTSLVGMGTGSVGVRHSSNQVRLGMDKFVRLVRHAYDQGITYFDTADQYGSHIYLREAIRGLPREKLFIQTKTRAQTADVAKADLDRFLEELGVPYVDTLLMHCMTTANWPVDMRPVMDFLTKAKEKGKVRAIGTSCHGMDPLRSAVKSDWVEVDLARINPVGKRAYMDGSPDEVLPCLKAMHDQGKGILGMKILGQGKFKTADEQRKSLEFVLGSGAVDAFVIGFESENEIDQILKIIDEIVKV